MEEILNKLGFSEIETAVYQMGAKRMPFRQMWLSILQGDFKALGQQIYQVIYENTVGEIRQNQGLFQEFLLLMVIAALVGYLSVLYEQSSVSRIAECMLTFLLTMLGLLPLYRGARILKAGLTVLFEISKILMPVFFMTMTIASPGVYTLGFSQIFTLFLFGIEYVMLSVLQPICGYMTVFSLMDSLWLEKRMKDLITGGFRLIGFGCKGAIFVISGSYFVKSQILSLTGQLKKENLEQLITMIPGFGKLTEGGLSLLFGSAALICKTTGVFVMLVAIIVCLPSLLQLVALAITMYLVQGVANLLLSSYLGDGLLVLRQIHLLEGIKAVTGGLFFLLKLLWYSICFFLLLVAVASFGVKTS